MRAVTVVATGLAAFAALLLSTLTVPAQVITPGGPSHSFEHPGYVAGQYYLPIGPQGHGSGVATTANSMRCSIGSVGWTVTISDLFWRVTTGGTDNISGAIYQPDPTTKLPGARVASTGDVSGGTASMISGALTASTRLSAGSYWWCTNASATAASLSVITSANNENAQLFGGTSLTTALIGTTTLDTGVVATQTYGTWPADATSLTFAMSNVVPAMGFKVESAP